MRGLYRRLAWHPPCIDARSRMRHVATLLLVVGALLALPAQGAAQRALKDHRFWAAPRVSEQRLTAWSVLTPPSWSSQPKSTMQLTLSTTRPALPRLSWRQSDVALASAFTLALLIDAAQTRGLARNGWRDFRETNFILGSNPTVGQLNTYTAIAGLSVLGAAAALPARVRPWLLGAALAVEAFTIAGTTKQGVSIRF